MEAVQIELTNHFTDKTAGTFVCKGDRFTAYRTDGCDNFMVFDHQYSSHTIPFDVAMVVETTQL